jgi:hypothetical protein
MVNKMSEKLNTVESVRKLDKLFEKVRSKTLHGKNCAKTPDDVLDNLTKDRD